MDQRILVVDPDGTATGSDTPCCTRRCPAHDPAAERARLHGQVASALETHPEFSAAGPGHAPPSWRPLVGGRRLAPRRSAHPWRPARRRPPSSPLPKRRRSSNGPSTHGTGCPMPRPGSGRDRPRSSRAAADAAYLGRQRGRAVELAGAAVAEIDPAADPVRVAVGLTSCSSRNNWSIGESKASLAALDQALASCPPRHRRSSWPASWPRSAAGSCSCPGSTRPRPVVPEAIDDRQGGRRPGRGRTGHQHAGRAAPHLGDVDEGIALLREALRDRRRARRSRLPQPGVPQPRAACCSLGTTRGRGCGHASTDWPREECSVASASMPPPSTARFALSGWVAGRSRPPCWSRPAPSRATARIHRRPARCPRSPCAAADSMRPPGTWSAATTGAGAWRTCSSEASSTRCGQPWPSSSGGPVTPLRIWNGPWPWPPPSDDQDLHPADVPGRHPGPGRPGGAGPDRRRRSDGDEEGLPRLAAAMAKEAERLAAAARTERAPRFPWSGHRRCSAEPRSPGLRPRTRPCGDQSARYWEELSVRLPGRLLPLAPGGSTAQRQPPAQRRRPASGRPGRSPINSGPAPCRTGSSASPSGRGSTLVDQDRGERRAVPGGAELGLTPREVEVLGQLAKGRTGRADRRRSCSSARRRPASTSPTCCASWTWPTGSRPVPSGRASASAERLQLRTSPAGC